MNDDMTDLPDVDPDAELVIQTDNGPRPDDGPQPTDQHAAPDVVPED